MASSSEDELPLAARAAQRAQRSTVVNLDTDSEDSLPSWMNEQAGKQPAARRGLPLSSSESSDLEEVSAKPSGPAAEPAGPSASQPAEQEPGSVPPSQQPATQEPATQPAQPTQAKGRPPQQPQRLPPGGRPQGAAAARASGAAAPEPSGPEAEPDASQQVPASQRTAQKRGSTGAAQGESGCSPEQGPA